MGERIAISDPDDERLAVFRLRERGLTNRADKRDDTGAGMFLAEGDLVVTRAHQAGCEPVAALADADRVPVIADLLNCPVFIGGDAVRAMVTGLGMPHPIVAVFNRPGRPSAASLLARSRRLVVAERVDNPANIGGIVRNAAGLGWDGLLLDGTSADPLSRRALRVAMGTAFVLPHARTRDLATVLADLGASIDLLALTPDPAAADIDTVAARLHADRPRAVLIGAERSGLSESLLAMSQPVRIPMNAGVDSLNAAAASAVACHVLR
jgi:tRNA G18 (ribose-2'-O)-methylase SpoU